MGKPWNHNIHYFPLILRRARRAHPGSILDAGTGDGMLAHELSVIAPTIGIDREIALAQSRYPDAATLRFVQGDLLTWQPSGERFDLVVCSATLHHLPLDAGLTALRDLTAPGGMLVIVGLALESTPGDYVISLASVIPNRIVRAVRGWHSHGAPTADPTETYSAVRNAATRIIPGAVMRRRLFWRYTLVWTNA